MKMPAAPAPFHILRNHSSPLSALSINPSNTLLYSGDQDGNVGITDLSSRRVVRLWKAQTESILSVEEWNGHLLR
jgi:WD40 repeat protein